MAQAVIKNIFLGSAQKAIDISDYISYMVYRRSIDKDNSLELNSKGAAAETLLSLDDLYPNKPVTFTYGYITGDISKSMLVVISDIEPEWSSSGLSLRIRCVDKGNTLKKVTSNRIWKKKNSGEIVKEIANLHGLKAAVVPVDNSLTGNPAPAFRYWESLPQTNANDMEFVQQLARKEDGSEFISYVDDDTLYYKPIGLDSLSRETVNIMDSEHVIKFALQYKETAIKGGEAGIAKVNSNGVKENKRSNARLLSQLGGFTFLGQSVLLVQNAGIYLSEGVLKVPTRENGFIIDAVTGKTRDITGNVPATSNAPAGNQATKVNPIASSNSGQNTGKNNSVSFLDAVKGGAGAFTGAISEMPETLEDNYTAGDTTLLPSSMSSGESSSLLNSKQAKNTRKILTAKLVLYGDPSRKLDSVITIVGIPERFGGNWYIEAIVDDVSPSGYITTLELSKNGVGVTNNGVKAKTVNASKGTSEPHEDTIKINATSGIIYNPTEVLMTPNGRPKGKIK